MVFFRKNTRLFEVMSEEKNQMSKKHQIDMTNGSIFGKLMVFSLPLVLSALLQLFFNAADIIVVGRFSGDNSLAAVGSTSSVINLLVNLFVGLSTGTNVVAAHYFGAQKKRELVDTVHTAILLSLISGVILTLAGVFGARQILEWMKSPPEVLDLAVLYLRIYFAGITATMVYNFGSALLRAKGDTKRPLYILFLAGLINIVLNLIFVICFKMDVAGVGLATVISQTVSAVLVIVLLVKETDEFHLDLKKLAIKREILVRIIKIGVPAGFQGIVFSLSNVVIQSAVNSFGSILVAGSSASSSIEGFVYTAMNGFAQGSLTFVSQNLGAHKFDRIKKVVLLSFLIVTVIGLCLGNLVVLTGPFILKVYSKSADVIKAAMIRLTIICSTYCLCGMMDVMANSIRGIGYSVLPMIVSLTGACGLRILWLATFFQIPKFHTPEVIFVSYPISWLVTLLVHILCFAIIFKKESKEYLAKK